MEHLRPKNILARLAPVAFAAAAAAACTVGEEAKNARSGLASTEGLGVPAEGGQRHPGNSAPAPAPTPVAPDDFETGQAPEVISGVNLVEVSFDNARARCDVSERTPTQYEILCAATALQKDGRELKAGRVARGTTLEWKAPVVQLGQVVNRTCVVSPDTLTQTCEVETSAPSQPTRLRFDLEIARPAANARRTESADVLLPYAVGVAAGFVPMIPFRYEAEAPPPKVEAEGTPIQIAKGMQLRKVRLAEINPDLIDAVVWCKDRLFVSAGSAVYAYDPSTGDATFHAGSVNPSNYDNLTHRYRVMTSPITSMACIDGGIVAFELTYANILWLYDDGRVARMDAPNGENWVAATPAGDVYYVDGDRVMKATPGGASVSVFAGGGAGGDGVPATDATLLSPGPLARLPDGSLLIYEIGSSRIRRVRPDGVIEAFAGTGVAGNDGDGGPALDAKINAWGMSVEADGAVYLATPSAVRRIDPATGTITTLLGATDAAVVTTRDDGIANPPQILRAFARQPGGVDWLLALRLVERKQDGRHATVMERRSQFYVSTCGEGPASRMWIREPIVLAPRPDGSVEIIDRFENGRFKLIRLTPPAAGQSEGTVGDYASICGPQLEGPREQQGARSPLGVAILPGGDAVTMINGQGKRVDRDGNLSDVAGLTAPLGVVRTTAPGGDVYLTNGHELLRWRAGQAMERIAGTGVAGFSGDGGAAVDATLRFPSGVLLMPDGAILVSDSFNNRVRRIKDGMIQTIAGDGVGAFEGDGGAAATARLREPTQLALLPDGAVLVVDKGNKRIRKLTPRAGAPGEFTISTFFGNDGVQTSDCATGVVHDAAAAGDVQARVHASLGAMCKANPTSVAVVHGCGTAGGRVRIYIGQAFGQYMWAGSHGNVIAIDQPCAAP